MFGKLVTSPEDSETEEDKREDKDKVDGDNDLKEHMVSILFSRSKLSHMQRQVGHLLSLSTWDFMLFSLTDVGDRWKQVL